MKRILITAALLAFFSGSSFAQLNVWRWQNPLPVGDFLRSVQMISQDEIYVCGDNGTFMSSTDGGQSWKLQSNVLKFNGILYSLNFLDQNYGMCCGDSGTIIKTTDGGASWQSLTTQTKLKLLSIVVVNKNIAIVITAAGTVIRTVDGGTTWTSIPVETSRALFSVQMLRPDFLTITGYAGVLLKSIDMGLTWATIPTPVGSSFYGAHFSDDNNGTLIGESGIILHTSNGGGTWTIQQLSDSTFISAVLNVIDSKDPNIEVIAGDYGTLLYTTNGGTDWSRSFIGTAEPIRGLSFFDKMTGTAVGRSGMILHTSDGGATWNFIPHKPYTEIFHSVAFPKGDTSLGITVGNDGAILRTADGGKNWALIQSGFIHILYSVCFLDSVTAIAVGERGTIIKSTDAGLTWAGQSSGTGHPLYAVSFSTPNNGLAVGDSGIILETYSAGQFWTRRYTTPVTFSDYFTGVSAPDPLHAYTCGASSIFKSTDGGISWNSPRGANSSRGRSISFGDSLHGGYVFSDKNGFGYVRSTSNGGITFDSVYPPGITRGLNGICFSDRQHATVVGSAGYIAHSTDGGHTWVQQQSNTVNDLNSVSYGTVKAGTAVGYRGNIMRISTDEILGVRQFGASGSPKIILDPNYPNPFSQSTTITYNLPASGFTTVEIFSVDGKKMAILANEFQISGDHSLRFDATGYVSGTYIVRVMNDGMTASRELIVKH